MAVLGNRNPTLRDVASRTQDKKIQTIAELLHETNDIIEDVVFMECNDGTKHQSTIRTGLPDVFWRKAYTGIQSSKSTTAKVEDATGVMESRAEIDTLIAELNGNSTEFRFTENVSFIEAMGQEFATTLFYGDATADPLKFNGLAPRFSDTTAKNARNILASNANSGSLVNSSIWLIAWGVDTVHGIYPKGQQSGLKFKDLGEYDAEDSSGNKYRALGTLYNWHVGLAVKDWRNIVRIQFDSTALTNDASSGADLVDLMRKATYRIPRKSKSTRMAFYMNIDTMEFLDAQIANKVTNSTLTTEQAQGITVTKFNGIPVRTCEAILNTEQAVS